MKLLIIQASPHHTASTFLVNALYGIIPECSNKPIKRIISRNWEGYFDDIIILKCHNTNIDVLMKKYKKYRTLFICSERKGKGLIDPKYRTYNNVVIFGFKELNETKNNSLVEIVDNIYIKVKKILPKYVQLDKIKCIERINNMNIRHEEIKNKKFSYIDPFFELHGSHRNR